MKVKVICTFPEYSGIFLNKRSKQTLLSRDETNPLRPKYPKRYGHHATLAFRPGQSLNLKYASLVALRVVRHIYDGRCQLIEVEPMSVTYRSLDAEPVTLTDSEEIVEALGGVNNVPGTLYITVSTSYEDDRGQKINHEYSEDMLRRFEEGDTTVTCETSSEDFILHGFVGMRCDAIIESGAIRKIENNNRNNRTRRYRNNDYNRGRQQY